MIIYLNETWYDSNETVRKLWADSTKNCSVSAPVSRGKRVVICHAVSKEGFVPNSLLLCGKDFAKSYADYHEDMNSAVFENWFRNTFLPNLTKGRKVAMMFDNAKYHSRLVETSPTMNTRKDQMIAFMKKHDIGIPEPVPMKAVLLERICQPGIRK